VGNGDGLPVSSHLFGWFGTKSIRG
jgi:hypothetical protein